MKTKDWVIPIAVVLIGTFGVLALTDWWPSFKCGKKPWCSDDLVVQVKPWDVNRQEFDDPVGEFIISKFSACRSFGPFSLANSDYSEKKIHLINTKTKATIVELVPREQIYSAMRDNVTYQFNRPEGNKPSITVQCTK